MRKNTFIELVKEARFRDLFIRRWGGITIAVKQNYR